MSLSNILKSVNSGEKRLIEITTPLIPLPEEPAEQQTPEETAKHIIQQARLEAETIRDQVSRERDSILQTLNEEREAWIQERENERRQARQEGYSEGLQSGLERAKEEWSERLNQAVMIVHRAEEDYKKYLDKSEEAVLHLSVAIAGRIVSSVLADDPQSWVELVKNAIQEVRDQETIKIVVSPSRYAVTVENRDALQSVSRDARIQIFPDDSLEENGCFIETPYGRIDASVNQQLSVIKQTLKEFLEAGSDGNRGTN